MFNRKRVESVVYKGVRYEQKLVKLLKRDALKAVLSEIADKGCAKSKFQ